MTAPVLHGDVIPLYMQPTADPNDPGAICYGASDFRLMVATVFPSPGVMSLSDWQITSANSALVNVGVGTAVVAGNSASEQRSYLCRNPTVKVIQPPGAPASANRYDLVCLTAHDGQITGDHLYEWQVRVISGVEAAAPVVPVLPKDSIALAAILRKPATPNILAADIADQRAVALLPSQPQSQKYWHTISAANSAAFTTTEVKDATIPNLVFSVTNAATIYRVNCFVAVQSGRINNLHGIYVRDGGAIAPTNANVVVAGGASISPVAGTAGIVTCSFFRDLSFAVGTHTLGVFARINGGVSVASYLVVPSGSQKQLSVQIIG